MSSVSDTTHLRFFWCVIISFVIVQYYTLRFKMLTGNFTVPLGCFGAVFVVEPCVIMESTRRDGEEQINRNKN